MIKSFCGDYAFLSNFHLVDILMPDGVTYPSSEHVYQAYKAPEQSIREYVSHLKTPTDAKRFVRSAGFRYPSDVEKLRVMEFVLVRKFRVPDLRQRLLDTGDQIIIEGNTWGDVFWGVCNGRGHNHLGQILMAIRSGLITGESRYI